MLENVGRPVIFGSDGWGKLAMSESGDKTDKIVIVLLMLLVLLVVVVSSVALARCFGSWVVVAIQVALCQRQKAMMLLVAVIACSAVDEKI